MSYQALYESYLEDGTIHDPGGDWLTCRCPFVQYHNNHDLTGKGSAGISKNTGVFRCHVCPMSEDNADNLCVSAGEFLHRLTGRPTHDCYAEVDMYRTEMGLQETSTFTEKKTPLPNPRFDAMYRRSLTYIDESLMTVKEYMAGRGLVYDTLSAFGLGYLPADDPDMRRGFKRDSIVFPYIDNGRVLGMRYRDMLGNKGGEKGSYLPIWNLDILDSPTDAVLMVEGETDALAAWQACEGKYSVVSAPSAYFKKEWARFFRDVRQVILIPQSDEAGAKLESQATDHLPGVVSAPLVWGRRQHGKDVADWLRYNGNDRFRDYVATTSKRSLRYVMPWSAFKRHADGPMDWLIENLLARNELGIIGGLPKAKKSFLSVNIIRSIILNEPFLGIPELKPKCNPDEPTQILFWEEEGSAVSLRTRMEMIFNGIDDELIDRHLHIGHNMGLKLDQAAWIERISRDIEEKKIDLLILDPFTRLHTKDENKEVEMKPVMAAIQTLLRLHQRLSIILLHHFPKGAVINDRWGAFRGSGMIGGEADLGFFIESKTSQNGEKIRLIMEGRSIPAVKTGEGDEVWEVDFVEGVMKIRDHAAYFAKDSIVYTYLTTHTEGATCEELAKMANANPNTFKRLLSSAIARTEQKESAIRYVLIKNKVYIEKGEEDLQTVAE